MLTRMSCSAPGLLFEAHPSMATGTALDMVNMGILKFESDIAPKVFEMKAWNLS